MELTTNDAFLRWAKPFGIGLNPEYPQLISFVPERGDSRFWATPYDADEKLAMITVCLDALDPWQSCWAYKREGGWTFAGDKNAWATDHGLDVITRWVGIPEGFAGSVRFDDPDRAKLVLLLMAFDLFGSNTAYDLFFVPDHGRQYLWLDHEDALWVFFDDARRVETFVSRMAATGFVLPDAPPSPIRWQHWMGPEPKA